MKKNSVKSIALAVVMVLFVFGNAKADGLLDLLRDYSKFKPTATSAPGFYDSTLVAKYNEEYQKATKATGLAMRDSMAAVLKKAYEDVKAAGYNEITPGYYYLTNCFDAYISKYGAPAAMCPDANSGLMKYKKFKEADKSLIYKLTPVPKATCEKLGLTDVIVVPEDTAAYIKAHWQSLGTSITWYNDNVSSAFTKGYQTRVREKLPFKRFSNKGVSGGVLESAIGLVSHADYYTIEHGINDWGHSTPVGTIDDYKNNTKNGTFAANYRLLIDAIYKANPKAMIVLCTPRKGYGFGTYLPAKCDMPLNGIYLKEYADIVREIAAYESLPVADFFEYCGGQRNLASLSIDVALHPNDNGYQLMADVLIPALRKVLLHPIINPATTEE